MYIITYAVIIEHTAVCLSLSEVQFILLFDSQFQTQNILFYFCFRNIWIFLVIFCSVNHYLGCKVELSRESY